MKKVNEQHKISSFWLNIGMLDLNMELGFRKQILKSLAVQEVEVRANFNYLETAIPVDGLDKVYFLKLCRNGPIGSILLTIEQQLTLLKNLDVDVVVLRPFSLMATLPLWFIVRKVLRRKKPKFVLDIRTLVADFPGFWKRIQRQIRFDASVHIAFRYFDGLTVITEKMKRDLQNKNNNFKKKLCVWSSGMDPILFNPDKVCDLREELKIENRFVIMYHGILSPGRGLQQAIKAIAIVRKIIPEVMLFFLGKGPAQNELEELIRNLGLHEHVCIHPAVPFEKVPCFVKSIQAGILPFPDLDCWNTSSPIKLTEYLAMGKPVIVTDIEAHRYALGKLECGFFIPDSQPENIANGIKDLFDRRSELPVLGKIARKAAMERFTLEKQAKKIKSYFMELTAQDEFSSF